jgi:predicted Zn-dependent protease
VGRLFSIAMINLYDGRWLTETEKEKGKARLAEYFAYSDPDRYSAGANEITSRIILAKRYIEKVNKNETVWTTPIPSAYFDIRQEKGFVRTKSWFKKHKQKRMEINRNVILTKAVNFYMRSLENGAQLGPAEAYRIVTQRLGKKSQQLVLLFNEQISGLQQIA